VMSPPTSAPSFRNMKNKVRRETSPATHQLRLEAPLPLLAAYASLPCSTASHLWQRRRPPMTTPPPQLTAPPHAHAASSSPPTELVALTSSRRNWPLQQRLPAFAAPAMGICSTGGGDLQLQLPPFAALVTGDCSYTRQHMQLHRQPVAAPPLLHTAYAAPPPPSGLMVRSRVASPCSNYYRRSKHHPPAIAAPSAWPCSTAVVPARRRAASPCSSYDRRLKQRRPAVDAPAAWPCSTAVAPPPTTPWPRRPHGWPTAQLTSPEAARAGEWR
jgi:hypothetical protein